MIMNKVNKIFLAVKIVVLIIIIIAILFISNFIIFSSQTTYKDDKIYGEQTEFYTNNPGDFVGENNFNIEYTNPNKIEFVCEKGKIVEIVDGEYQIDVEILNKEDEICKVFAVLTRAPGFESFFVGSNATCYLTKPQIDNLSPSTNIADLNCSGQLYELAKMR